MMVETDSGMMKSDAENAAIAQAFSEEKWELAETLCREALGNEDNAMLLGYLACALRKQGRADEAADAFRRAVERPEVPAAVWFNFGNFLFDSTYYEKAERAFEEAVALDATMVSAMLQSARCAMRREDLTSAGEKFSRLLAVDPGNFSGWLESGHVFRKLGSRNRMLHCYSRAAAISPERIEAHIALFRAHIEAGRTEEAAVAGHKALGACRSKQDERVVYKFMGGYRLDIGDNIGALDVLRAAMLCAELEYPRADVNVIGEIRIDLALALWRLGLTNDAKSIFVEAAQATSEATLTRLAQLVFNLNEWELALECLRRSAGLHPGSAGAHWNLAWALNETWNVQEALRHLDVAESLMPFPGAAGMRASIALKMGDADDALQKYIKISDADRGLKTKVCSSMCALYSDTLSTQDVARLHTDVFNFVGKAARRPDSFTNDLDPHRRLRIGLVTGDFHHQHPVNIFMQPMLKRLNRDNFEVTVYFTGRSYDEQTRLAKRRVERWQDCASWSDAQLAERIEGDAIDVLVDLAGHTSTNRLGVFALRAAPVQASFLGYPHSTGLPSMDWLFGDETVSPEEHLSLFSEKLALFPECVFCWAPENQYPLPAPRARNAPLVFGSFNNANKISPGTIELWSRILLLIPGSRLLLKAPTLKDHMVRDVFAGRFERNGVSPDRLELRGPSALDEMMREYGDMDIALDPLPYNGGTTTMQALWMGVPVLTRTGGNFAQRMGTSFLKTLGRQDLIASNEDGYVAAAERLAGRLDEIRAGREQLRSEMLASKVCAIDEYVCHFEALLRKMWQARCAGEEPRVLKLS